MRDWDSELAALKRLCPGLDRWTDGGRIIPFLPDLKFEANGKAVTRDALLWPYERDSYASRLFLSERAPSRQNLNWNLSFNLQGRHWHSWSWKEVSNAMPLTAILVGHLQAFR